MRIAGGTGTGGSSSFPPSGTLQIVSGGPNNASPTAFDTSGIASNEIDGCSDNSGNTIIFHSLTAAPFAQALLQVHSTGYITPLTLSGFGTFTSFPKFHFAGYDIENLAFWMCFSDVGGSGSLVVDTLYPVTLSGSTLTLGAGITPPVIAGKAVCPYGNSVNNGKIVQVYSDTTNYRVDTTRVFDISGASWAAPAGATASPYAANPNATLDSNVPDEASFATGSQNSKGYFSMTHASELPIFVEFEFTGETFTDRTSLVPISMNGTETSTWSMGLDPSGNYGVGFFRNSNTSIETIFCYDTANDACIAFYEININIQRKIIAGDESAGNLGLNLEHVTSGTLFKGYKMPYINETSPTSGTLAGVEAVGEGTNSDYGASACAMLVNIDAGGWEAYQGIKSLWSLGGYERLMRTYADTLEVIFIPSFTAITGAGVFGLTSPATIYYTN